MLGRLVPLRPSTYYGNINLTSQNGAHARVLECSLDEDEDDVTSGTIIFFLSSMFYSWLLDWLPGDEFAAMCRVSLSLEDEPGEEEDEDDVISGPGEHELSWRRCATHLFAQLHREIQHPTCSEFCQTATTDRSARVDSRSPTCNRHARASLPYYNFLHPRSCTPPLTRA